MSQWIMGDKRGPQSRSQTSAVARLGNQRASYVPDSTVRIAQLTGWNANTKLQPRVNSRDYGILGTDLGIPAEHDGRLYFFFGDCDASKTMEADADPIAWTDDSPEATGGPLLHWLPGPSCNTFHRLHVEGCDQLGNFEVPSGAFSYRGRLYVFIARDAAEPPAGETDFCGDRKFRMRTSQLAVTKEPENDPHEDLEHVYQVASLNGPFQNAGRWLIHVSPTVVRNADWPGLPTATADGLIMFGTGCYHLSNLYLAWAPLDQSGPIPIPHPSQWYYRVEGAPANGQDPANWRRADRLAGKRPSKMLSGELRQGSPTRGSAGAHNATLGEISVIYHQAIRRWIFIYVNAGSVVIRTARKPWGPWSLEVPIFNGFNPTMDACNLNPARQFVGLSLAFGEDKGRPTGPYAPYLVRKWCRFEQSTRELTLYYTLSVEHPPYNVQMMRSVVKFQ